MTMPKRIFVASMSDLFHEDVSGGFLFEVFEVMRLAPQHTYMILTKRPERVLSFYRRSDDSTWRSEVFTDNIWFGATIEDQARADERTPISMEIPTAVRFVSIEPMLGPVDLRHVQTQDVEIDALTGNHGVKRPLAGRSDRRLDWVICGGETGPGARPMHPDWVRSLRDQCREAGVPFFFKSWGDWVPSDQAQAPSGLHEPGRWHGWDSGLFSYRVGKAKAGRVLDGEVWDEMPGMETGS
jgi:protein gp37